MQQEHPNQPCVNTDGRRQRGRIDRHGDGKRRPGRCPQDAVPGMGWLAYCTDPEGHVFGMMQSDTSAK